MDDEVDERGEPDGPGRPEEPDELREGDEPHRPDEFDDSDRPADQDSLASTIFSELGLPFRCPALPRVLDTLMRHNNIISCSLIQTQSSRV